MIVPDHIGCGLSDKPDDSRYTYTLASRVDDLERLLDHLGLDRDLTLVLHDWGGMIGMAYAARHPERIARLVVSNTAAFHKPASKPLPGALAICRDSRLGAFVVRGLNAFCQGTAWIGCKRNPMNRELRQAYVAPYDSWSHRIAILRFVQDIPLHPGDRAYELVSWVQGRLDLLRSVPMLILWGMKDFVFDYHFLDEWVRYFPTAEVHRFPRAGHYLFEDEAEAINGLVPCVPRGPPRHQGARRLSQISTSAERSNIAIHLSRMAIRQPHTMAVVVPDGRDRAGRVRYTHLTYRQLDQDSNRIAQGLKAIRDRPWHASRGDGAARARLLFVGFRPVQGGRRARVDRPGNRPAEPGSMLPRSRAGGLYRHLPGLSGPGAFSAGDAAPCGRPYWSRRAAPECSVQAPRRSTTFGS